MPTRIAGPERQRMCNEAVTKNCTLSFESWTTDRQPFNTSKNFQLDIGSPSIINAPCGLIVAHQKTEQIDPANPATNLSNDRFINAIFHNVTDKKHFTEIRAIRDPEYPINKVYAGKFI